MKSFRYLLFLLLLSVGCGKEEKIVFEEQLFNGENCSTCPEIRVKIPVALDNRKISETVNDALKEEVISLLAYDEGQQPGDIPEAISSFRKGFDKLQDEFPDETVPWEANIEAQVTFENEDILTIGLNSYIFTGGAHGYGSTRFLNFHKKSGQELDNSELFKNHKKFVEFAEDQFRRQQKIKPDQPINSTGFMFEGDEFYLPENIGYTENGLKLLYNPYEVASYADGTIELLLPYTDINSFLELKI
ncbi:MAG: DUF3298 and DUF4163 domain-containing protein [Flavobacteriaceae bacterium]